MKAKTFLFIFLILLLPSYYTFAQQGDLFLYNYQVPIRNVDNQNHAVIQGNNGLMYFANKRGILSYDGVTWELIKTLYTPYSLAVNKKPAGKVYVGCRESFGYITSDSTGKDTYAAISEGYKDFEEIKKIIIIDGIGYFYSDEALFQVSLKYNQVLREWRPGKRRDFLGIAEFNNKIYINIQDKGLHLVTNNGLVLMPNTQKLGKMYMHASFEFGKSKMLLGMGDNQCYFYDGRNPLKIFGPSSYAYIFGNVVSGGIDLSDEILGISTVSGGVILINKRTYKTENIINYQTGLPDDEVYATCTDSQSGMWICHAEGITRVDLGLPIRIYSSYVGLEGNIETSLKINDSLYVATSDGLFYLSEVSQYEQIESYIKKEQKYFKTIENTTRTVKINEPRGNATLRRYTHSRGGKKENKRKILIDEETKLRKVPTREVGTEVVTAFFRTKEARKAYALQSIPFVYKQVIGLDAKCRQILTYQDKIIVASNLGLYQVVREEEEIFARPILQNVYVNFVYQSKKNPRFFYVCTNDGLIVLALQSTGYSGYWQVINRSDDETNTNINSIVESGNTLWLGGESQVFRMTIDDKGRLSRPRKYSFRRSYSEDVIVQEIRGVPTFILSSGVFSYSPEKDKIFKNPRLQKYFSARSQVLYLQDNYTWVKDFSWQNVNQPRNEDSLRLDFLEFFHSIHDINVDQIKDIWVIDQNLLYRVYNNVTLDSLSKFDIFIKHVFHRPDTLLPLGKDVFQYKKEGVSFTFKMASPFYQSEASIRYQYWLEGLSKEWSDWDTKAIISFPYLPSGKYKLHVRAKNIYGQISDEKIFPFEIEPPFWETTWFYGLQISILVGLLLASFIFNVRGKQSALSYILTFVSIITLFEFLFLLLEPYVEEFSNGIPLFKLGMNILLAVSLAPAERLLKNLMHKPAQRKPIENPSEEAETVREST